MDNNNKPKHFMIFKCVGFLGIILAFIGFILTITGFGDFESNNFMIGGFMVTFGLFIGISGLIIGFRPEITKMATKSARYIQQENKEDFIDIATNTADITSEAITKTTKAIKILEILSLYRANAYPVTAVIIRVHNVLIIAILPVSQAVFQKSVISTATLKLSSVTFCGIHITVGLSISWEERKERESIISIGFKSM